MRSKDYDDSGRSLGVARGQVRCGRRIISSLRHIDFQIVDDLVDFVRGPGFVLDFSDRTFRSFFESELGVDINDDQYKTLGTSKGKRLRCFLQKVTDATALKALQAIWDHRSAYLARASQPDPVAKADELYAILIARLRPPATGKNAPSQSKSAVDRDALDKVKSALLSLHNVPPQARGYAFEKLLKDWFDLLDLDARSPFRLIGEQIDGSFKIGEITYLLEAKWQSAPVDAKELRNFQGKLDEKAPWVRGLFVSFSGFTEDGLKAFGRGKRVICIDGLDLSDCLDRYISLRDVIERKDRRAAETGSVFSRVRELFP